VRIRLYEEKEGVMMTNSMKLGRVLMIAVVALSLFGGLGAAFAADEVSEAGITEVHGDAHGEEKEPLSGYLAIGAALSIGLTALATGMAQARIGAAGIGAIAENPKRIGMVIMLVAIPETVAILGFVIAYLIIS
jgi:V/A-type H+-transporting ATPase subunit K